MSRHDDLTSLRQMLEFSELVIKHASGRTLGDLQDDELFSAALMHWLGLIGESANRVSRMSQKKHPEIPWADVVGMRNRVIHGYDELNLKVLWDTIQHDIPELAAALRAILKGSR